MAQERSGENQEKTKASRGILATDGGGGSAHSAAAGRQVGEAQLLLVRTYTVI